MTELEIIDLVKARAMTGQIRTDQADLSPTRISKKLTQSKLEKSIQELGFQPAGLYVDILTQIGNGGFGPGYGLMGLMGGAADDMGMTSVGLYSDFSRSDPNNPSWVWPKELLPVCHWGCAIYSCIDCTTDQAIVKTWDPNDWEDGTSPHLAIRSTGLMLEDWLREWSTGINLWEKMFPSA